MSLHITYNDGSNPFYILNAPKKIIDNQIRWQKRHNGDTIGEIMVIHDDMRIEYLNIYILKQYQRLVWFY